MTTPITSTGTPNAAANAAASASSLTSAADQQDRFMKLLVAQMKNQDPLNPMDNAQMTSQVAQINTVGGIEKLNTTVNSLLAAFGNLQAQTATQLAGRGVLIEGNQLQLTGDYAVGGVQLGAAADTVTVEIVDAAGVVGRRIPVGASPAGSRSFVWDGKLADGSQAADGTWKFRVVATSAGKDVAATPLVGAQVLSVSHAADGTVQLDLGAKGVKPMDAVRSYF
ncbi:MAG TPA: flagellar hook assembly protein FlgD [Ramlibacter sp.]|jgi:flagellar basal-body rod modification protein FlgD|uniref:flagellar hook assembly protein FlgD n=1 Tax=Ramlibacter sp. TaxID=1917967 RepID=UPI002D6F0EC2|nr:flagellar hook assembly protein FlgD [Ramlibacter sp.]HZY18571.1 flagellar hook assembly protein FlgD [Ramlibacter sp.]